MATRDDEHWEVMRLPETAVEDFLRADDPLNCRVDAPHGSVQPPIVALSRPFAGLPEEDFDAAVREAARLFRRAESHMTDRLGAAQSVEIDEEPWTPRGLPAPVLAAAYCTMSLVSVWDLPGGGGWCVLELHQADRDAPLMLLLYTVAH